MQIITLKKPNYLGTSAQIVAAQAEAETRGQAYADRSRVARAAIGRFFLGHSVKIVRIGGLRHVLVEDQVPAGIECECDGVIRFAGEDGGIVISIQ